MKIVYVGQDTKKRKAEERLDDVIILLFDRWDDYNYQTRFPTRARLKGEPVELGSLRILFEGHKTSYEFLDKLIEKGWDGVFPIPGTNYISTPEALSFYEQIEGHLGLESAIDVADTLRDASYYVRLKDDPDATHLVNTQGFRNSLQRERGSIKAFLDGWKLFGRKTIFIEDQTFRFRSTRGQLLTLDLIFSPNGPLPHDINVLIGPNGVGKSQLLHQVVSYWLDLNPDRKDEVGFAKRPNLNQVVVISYSPFELFPVDTADIKDDAQRKDLEVYRYFGLRGRKKALTDKQRGSEKITLNRIFPRVNAAHSLLDCLADDQKYGGITAWSNKLETMESVLRSAIDFDSAAIVVDVDIEVEKFFPEADNIEEMYLDGDIQDEDSEYEEIRYIPISSDRVASLKVSALKKYVHASRGIVFLKDDMPLHLSSGQRLFSYIVINILGAIRRNSLIIVDEPELFLHPTLEVEFIRMLKSILAAYGSKALVATHSLVTVREIPRSCVHVFEDTDDGIVVKTPPFETFGGDVQRISSYVFGDKSISKPYEEWIREKLKEYGSAESLIVSLGKEINEELLIQISAMEAGKW